MADTRLKQHLWKSSRKDAKKRRNENTLKLATWNVRTMKQVAKLHLLLQEMECQNVQLLGLSEVRWDGDGHFKSGEHTIVYSGGTRGRNGVVVVLNKELGGSLISYNPINNRLIIIKLQMKQAVCLHVVQITYQLQNAMRKSLRITTTTCKTVLYEVPNKDALVVMGDLNAKVGSNVRFGLGEGNRNGDHLVEFCEVNNLALTNALFNHHPRRRYTWTSPYGTYRNQIDYTAI